MGRLRQMRFENLLIDHTGAGTESHLVLTGVPGGLIEDISLSGIRLWSAGGVAQADVQTGDIPELIPENLGGHWPEYYCFQQVLPASGLYARHIRNLRLRDLDFRTEAPDAREPIVLHDVSPEDPPSDPPA